MAKCCLSVLFGMVVVACGSAFADPTPKKPHSVQEQSFNSPLEFKTEPDTKLHGVAAGDPPGLTSLTDRHPRYLGLGLKVPLGTEE